jgi:serine/threonine protein kinase
LTELGRGGMGVVYKARQENLNRVVALKTVLIGPQTKTTVLARFAKEAQAVAQLRHPNIVVAFDFGRQDDRLYFVMELLEGEDLSVRLSRGGPLPEALAWSLARQTASGLAHAHAAGIVHRDIKPSNLFLVEPPTGSLLPTGHPLVKITDFGLVLVQRDDEVSDRLTADRTLLGTPQYMAPEQFRGSDVDHRADIYSLGATVYHMLCGHPPFQSMTIWEVMTAKQGADLPSLTVQASPATIRLLSDMMAANRDQRLSDYRRLIDRIDNLAESSTLVLSAPKEPATLERPAPQPPPQHKSPSRLWPVGLLIILVVVGGAVGLGWWYWSTPSTPIPTLVVGSRRVHLFDGVALSGWQIVDGQWLVARDAEGGQVLSGLGLVRRPLPDYENYRLTLGVDRHQATMCELQFGFHSRDAMSFRHVLQLTADSVVIGWREGHRAALQTRSTRPLPSINKEQSPYQELKVERQGKHWWVFHNGVEIGVLPAAQTPEAPWFQLLVEGRGPALFADLEATELIPPEP